MQRRLDVTDSVIVASPPEQVWPLVADPRAYARFSPENTAAQLSGHGLPRVGETFEGRNRRGPLRWSTRCVVTDVDPMRVFAFRVEVWGLGRPRLRIRNASWSYRLEPVDAGTRVTETWTDDRHWPDAVAAVVDRLATGGSTFAEFQRRNIATSLDRLRRVVESGAGR